ncbi:MAG: hypothetical protein K9M54_07775 [Kiritimatiellales bacterium]|nr:hypothetical protein [Kiritimatiellales bacterium]
MKHRDHEVFTNAIHSLNKVQVRFFSQKDGADVTRTCAPMDFGPKAKENPPKDRYHCWDFSSPSRPHTESLEAEHIHSITLLDEKFKPEEFMQWQPNWHVPRDWGSFS